MLWGSFGFRSGESVITRSSICSVNIVFYSEDVGNKFLRNVGIRLQDTTSQNTIILAAIMFKLNRIKIDAKC
jgi:hypothetical protein